MAGSSRKVRWVTSSFATVSFTLVFKHIQSNENEESKNYLAVFLQGCYWKISLHCDTFKKWNRNISPTLLIKLCYEARHSSAWAERKVDTCDNVIASSRRILHCNQRLLYFQAVYEIQTVQRHCLNCSNSAIYKHFYLSTLTWPSIEVIHHNHLSFLGWFRLYSVWTLQCPQHWSTFRRGEQRVKFTRHDIAQSLEQVHEKLCRGHLIRCLSFYSQFNVDNHSSTSQLYTTGYRNEYVWSSCWNMRWYGPWSVFYSYRKTLHLSVPSLLQHFSKNDPCLFKSAAMSLVPPFHDHYRARITSRCKCA